ncbi:MAG: serine protease [Gammaproteobacteria bacterium]|nr:serine protease [Gammaproteobacteria bacterium]
MIKKIQSMLFLVLLGAISLPLYADGISSAEKVYADVNQSIFTILDVKNSDKTKAVAYGSAVAVKSNLLATNCHVLKGDQQLVKIGKNVFPSRLVSKDEASDICLIAVEGKKFKPVKFRSSKSVRIGEEVYTIGSPKGYEKSISRGIISNEITYRNGKVLQTDAAISPGSSGGGLFDTKGNLIGLTFLKDEGVATEGIGFAVPTEVITVLLSSKLPISV